MNETLQQNKQWIEEVWRKIETKLEKTSVQIGDKFPHQYKDGEYRDVNEVEDIYWWTNGFWPGICWLMYLETKKPQYKELAESLELQLDEALYGFKGLHHDVGFMWLISSIANYRLTGHEKSRIRGQIAANYLAARFNIKGKFIRAWNEDKITHKDMTGWSIIDSMMNMPLLYWASENGDDPHFKYIAMEHADTVMNKFVRPDGSVNHIVNLDKETGDVIETFGGQGYENGSSWSRGQSWALYGFVLSYIHTGKREYLDTAKRVAHYFISNIYDDFIPACDFRAPKTPIVKDSTAGAIAACGLIEIAKSVGGYEQKLYIEAAMKILKALEAKCCNWSENEQAILGMGTVAYHFEGGQHIPIIYGDYYFIEAILKLKGNELLFW